MIIDGRQMSELTDISGSIAIIGAGAAGITLAIELADHFKDVLVLESGTTVYEEETQDLNCGKVLGHTQPDLRTSRLRFLGGTTNHWYGRCAPLDPIDFERLPDRPYSGWPFGFTTLVPFYNRAYRYCQIDTLKQGIPNVYTTMRKLFQGSELQLTEFRYSPPTLFGEEYRSMLDSSDRIKVYLIANFTNIGANEAKRAIQFLAVRSLNGRMLTVTAKAFVLCCGGIENARILLNCTSDFATGLGNQHNLVGRFFMDHLLATAGFIVPQIEIYDLGPFDLHNSSLHALMNSAETVQQSGRRGCCLFMEPIYDILKDVETVPPSYQAIRQIVQYAKRGSLTPDFGKLGCAALEEPQAIARALYHRLSLRATGAVQSIRVSVQGEQSPNPASRVTLSDDID